MSTPILALEKALPTRIPPVASTELLRSRNWPPIRARPVHRPVINWFLGRPFRFGELAVPLGFDNVWLFISADPAPQIAGYYAEQCMSVRVGNVLLSADPVGQLDYGQLALRSIKDS